MTAGRIKARFEGRNMKRDVVPRLWGLLLQGVLCTNIQSSRPSSPDQIDDACHRLRIGISVIFNRVFALTQFLFFFAALQLFSSTASHAENYALVIGISNYDYVATREGIIPLGFPDDDARDLKVSLEAKGYKVISLIDEKAERQDIISAFVQLREIITEEDSFILFFAGHGMRDAQIEHTFWLTYDTKLSNLDHNGIRLSHLMDYIGDIKASKKLVLLDHCFSGDMSFDAPQLGLARDSAGIEANISRGALPVQELQSLGGNQSQGIAILAAARDQAFEHAEYQNGIFTEALIRAMDTRDADISNDGVLSLSELEDFLNVQVVELSRSLGTAQRPVSVINAQGISEWALFSLPENEPQAAEISAEYKSFLVKWATTDPPLIDQQVKFKIYQTLGAWVAADANLAMLNTMDRSAMDNLRGNMDFLAQDPANAETVAEILNQELKHIYGLQ